MSSAPTGRYQSRLFNFLNKQSQRLTDQYDRTIRHLKVATVWGAQILLYPIYMMVQGGLAAGRGLAQSAEAGWPQIKALTNTKPLETPPTADTPIEKILEEINRLALPQVQNQALPKQRTPKATSKLITAATTNLVIASPQTIPHPQSIVSTTPEAVVSASPTDLNTTTQTSSRIQGVGTLLENRALVLVTIENQIIDILTPQQQKKLASKISWELADQRRQWRLAESRRHRFAVLAALEQPHVLAPVKLFWHLMAWVQTSPIAIAANLFDESTLVITTNHHPLQLHQRLPPQTALNSQDLPQIAPSALFFLDRTVAELESHQLIPGTEIVIALSERTTRSLQQHSQKLIQKLQTPFLKPNYTDATDISQRHTPGIQSLIYAAVDYFFGQRTIKLPGTDFQESSTIPGKPQNHLSAQQSSLQFPATEADPWLTWGDLYDTQTPHQVQTSAATSKIQKSHKQLPEAFNSKIPGSRNSILGVIKRYLGFQQPSDKLSVPTLREKDTTESALLVVQTSGKLRIRPKPKSNSPSRQQKSASSAVKSRNKPLPAKTANAIAKSKSAAASGDLDAAPDWIETPATPNGYIKHPLEQLLEWLDLAMLWLEEFVVKIWRSLGGR